MKSLVLQIMRYTFDPRPSKRVSPYWLFRSQSALNNKFAQTATVRSTAEGNWSRIEVNDVPYYWPASAPRSGLLQIVAELSMLNHPHQYLWGHTKLEPGDICIDVGACEGGFAAEAAALGASVVGVEPSRIMQEGIELLCRERQVRGVKIVGALLGEQNGMAWYDDNANNPGGSRLSNHRGYEVPIMSLDRLVEEQRLPRLNFIKCDAEGMDAEILRSGRRVLSRFRPKIAVTTYHNREDFEVIRGYLLELGYRVKGKGFLRSGNELRVTMLHAW
jgi:FkbM family methyltransferase